jgi:hypothetical protein
MAAPSAEPSMLPREEYSRDMLPLPSGWRLVVVAFTCGALCSFWTVISLTGGQIVAGVLTGALALALLVRGFVALARLKRAAPAAPSDPAENGPQPL